MTARLPFTQLSVRRAIAAARKEGLRVTGIRPDGTVIVGENQTTGVIPADPPREHAVPPKWEEVEA